MILKILIYFSSINEKHIEIKYASVKTKLCTNKSDIIGKKMCKITEYNRYVMNFMKCFLILNWHSYTF